MFEKQFNAKALDELYVLPPTSGGKKSLIIMKVNQNGERIGNPYTIEKYEDFKSRSLDRLEKRVFGKPKGKALKQAFKVVRDNGGLDISGEYGSLEINGKILSYDLTLRLISV
jgi:hypothetical protein